MCTVTLLHAAPAHGVHTTDQRSFQNCRDAPRFDSTLNIFYSTVSCRPVQTEGVSFALADICTNARGPADFYVVAEARHRSAGPCAARLSQDQRGKALSHSPRLGLVH